MRGAATDEERATGSSSALDVFRVPVSKQTPTGKASQCRQRTFMIDNTSEHFIPGRAVLEHCFAQQADGRHAVAQHLVVKFLQ